MNWTVFSSVFGLLFLIIAGGFLLGVAWAWIEDRFGDLAGWAFFATMAALGAATFGGLIA